MAHVLITGSNRGIGLELARQYQARGDHVIAVCRSSSPELQELDVHIIEGVDVTDDDSVEALNASLGDVQLDLLINNAGLLQRVTLDSLDFDSIRKQFEVNSLGPLRVTAALLPHLGSGAKVAIITSRMGSITDNTSGSHYGYRMSKAAVNMAAKSLSVDLEPRGIPVCVLHPGWVQTDMGGPNALITVETSASGLIERIDALSLETTGGFWHTSGERLSW